MLGTAEEAGQVYTPPIPSSQSMRTNFWGKCLHYLSWNLACSVSTQQPEYEQRANCTGDLQTWNYALYPGVTMNEDYGKFDEYWGIGHVLRDMAVSDKAREHGGRNEVMFLQHGHNNAYHELIEDPYQVNGQWYHASKSRVYRSTMVRLTWI